MCVCSQRQGSDAGEQEGRKRAQKKESEITAVIAGRLRARGVGRPCGAGYDDDEEKRDGTAARKKRKGDSGRLRCRDVGLTGKIGFESSDGEKELDTILASDLLSDLS